MKKYTYLFNYSGVVTLRPARTVYNTPAGETPKGLTEGPKAPRGTPEQAATAARLEYSMKLRVWNDMMKKVEPVAKKNIAVQAVVNKYQKKMKDELPEDISSLDATAHKENLAIINKIIKDFGNEYWPALKRKPIPEPAAPAVAMPEELKTDPLEANRKDFERARVAALAEIDKVKENKYTRGRADAGRYFVQLRADINAFDLDANVRKAESPEEINKVTDKVKMLSSNASIDRALKMDWAASLINGAIGRVFEKPIPNEDPKALLARVQANLRADADKEPFASMPQGTVFMGSNYGIDIQFTKKSGKEYVASISGMEDYQKINYPRIAKYVDEQRNA